MSAVNFDSKSPHSLVTRKESKNISKVKNFFSSTSRFSFHSFAKGVLDSINRKPERSFDASLEELLKKTEGSKDYSRIDKELDDFVNAQWKGFPIPESCKDKQNKSALKKKLAPVFMDHLDQSIEEKFHICKNICQNFSIFLSESDRTVRDDIENDETFQSLFHLNSSDPIKKIVTLGCESHNKGQVPLLIEFSSGKKILFKPRPMISEKLLCGHEDSLFKRLGFEEFTYLIHDKKTYGYSEFIENEEKHNTFNTLEEICDYLKKFHVLQKYCKKLGISDLHQENIRTRSKVPMIIDGEVIAPSDSQAFETGIFADLTAGYLFTSDTGNRIWFSNELMLQLDLLTAQKMKNNDFGSIDCLTMLSSLDVMGALNYEEKPFESEESAHVLHTKRELSVHAHRMIAIETEGLKELIKNPLKLSSDSFIQKLAQGLLVWGFTFDVSQEEKIRDCFREDLLNNDVPVFYYRPDSKVVYYHGIEIAYMQNAFN